MKKYVVLVIDGQGGGIGKQLTQSIKERFPELFVRSVGTNVMATQAMIKAGADEAATGENAVIAGCGQSDAIRILIPINQCDNQIVGVENYSLTFLIRCCIDQIQNWLSDNK